MRHDNLILAAGFIRCFVWLFGAAISLKFKRYMVAAGFSLSAINSVAFALFNAHYAIPARLIETINYESTVAVALIVAGFIFGTVAYSSHKRWTP